MCQDVGLKTSINFYSEKIISGPGSVIVIVGPCHLITKTISPKRTGGCFRPSVRFLADNFRSRVHLHQKSRDLPHYLMYNYGKVEKFRN